MATDSDAVVREGLSSVTKGTLFLLVSTLVLVGLTFVSRVLIVRTISPTDWDAYSFGLTLAGVLAALGALGLPNAIARSLPYAATDEERRTIVRGSLWIGSIAGVAGTVLLYVLPYRSATRWARARSGSVSSTSPSPWGPGSSGH